ncbi:biotin--[acetyl-CoA-carboxylase] ligase [Luteolibacter flavescens]|uniref:biotin--[biotin carboxyl-carrier protein] ligase n=1 Tax=Luteolibacter flavescens TaxID=1859460 RepID=A0ABT3FJK3_9BACT|nr:biotin--[acetyl-CoA-carboxylase] ligase [Luteolibacter flavescens]MCW1883642.1 biotin--[acetyl-CoA-carboxylase] ligase [Luteolibacter flavescens]
MSSVWDHAELPAGYRLDFREVTGSTNDDIRAAAQTGARAGLVIVAERQEAGRGRRGAAWVCPPGEGLAFSVLLRPSEPKALWPRLSLAAGLAVAEGLDRHGVSAEVKWPNDVWIGGKKIAGILVEAGDDFVVVGIGINVGVTAFPDALESSATSLALECGEAPGLPPVLASILERLPVWQSKIGKDFDELLRNFRERCALTGKTVRLTCADGIVTGNAVGIGDGGELLIRTADGVRRIVQAEEVRVVEG